MPTVAANLRGMPASYGVKQIQFRNIKTRTTLGLRFTFSSARENPRPARTRRLYLMLGQRTMGFNLSTGRGATAAAF